MQRCKNGDVRCVRIANQVIEIRGRNYLAAIWHDITEQQRAETALRATSEFLRILLDAIPTPICTRIWRAATSAVTGPLRSSTARADRRSSAKPCSMFLPVNWPRSTTRKDLELLQQSGLQVYEAQVKDARGVTRNVIFHKATFSDADGGRGWASSARFWTSPNARRRKLHCATARNATGRWWKARTTPCAAGFPIAR